MKTWNVIKWVLMACGLAATAQAQLSIMPVNPNKQLDSWGFNDATWTSDLGYVPVSIDNLNNPPGFDGNALQVDYSMGPAWLNYNVVEVDGTTNLTFNNGTVELWFLPDWNSGTGPGDWGRLIDVGQCTTNASAGWWSLYFSPDGNWLYFTCQTNGTSTNYLSCPIAWDTNTWHFVALTYNHLRTLLYIDGQLATSGPGISLQPPASARAGGFYVGSDLTGTQQARGVMDDLVTYNYAIASEQVTNDFQSGQQIVSPVAGAIRMADSTGGGINPGGGGLNGGGGGGAFQYNFPVINTNLLWLNVTNVSGGLAYLNLFNATNQVYAIWSTTDLLSNWQVETEVWPTDTNCMSFTVLTSGRANLFMQAEDWTGVTENGNATPDWWFWMYFGTTELSDTNLDASGNPLVSDYTNGVYPNVIQFTLTITNQYVNGSTVPVQINLTSGIPRNIGILVNDTNPADATWSTYAGPVVNVPTPSDGVYFISIGLSGPASGATQTWETVSCTRDSLPPVLLITNLPSLTGSRPFIDPAGYSTKALSAINYTVVTANGTTNAGQGFVTHHDLNPWAPNRVTNWFKCDDLGLMLGTNQITIQAVDWAGNQVATNFSYLFDTNGDTTAPAMTIIWPTNGTCISGGNFTIQGAIDDDTATVTLQYTDGNGNSQTVNGLVERGGNLWVENVPLQSGTNTFILMAQDAAGNQSSNNITVIQSDMALVVYPVGSDQLSYATATVYGTADEFSEDPCATISVNGVQGINYGNGYWEVDDVPLNTGGTVVFNVTAQPSVGPVVQVLLESERPSVVYTKTYQYDLSLQYVSIGEGTTNGSGNEVDTFNWTQGGGGVMSENGTYTNWISGTATNLLSTTIWPSDAGFLPSLPGTCIKSSSGTPLETNTVPGPEVQWIEQAAQSGTIPVSTTYTLTSSREVMLFTGGKALRQQNTLFALTDPMQYETNPKLDDHVWDFPNDVVFAYQNDDSIPSEQIGLGSLGTLGNDGKLWTVQPNGESVSVTPEITGSISTDGLAMISNSTNTNHPSYAKSDSGQKASSLPYPVHIIANSTIRLSPDTVVTNAHFCVGQFLAFSAGPLPAGESTTYNWSFPGVYKNADTNNGPYCSTDPYVNSNLLTNAISTAWWVSGGLDANIPATYTASATITINFTNRTPITLNPSGQFYMHRPKALVASFTGTVSIDNYYVIGSGFGLHYGNPLFLNNYAGILFMYTISLPTNVTGTLTWAQVGVSVTRKLQTNDVSGQWYGFTAANALDGDPYSFISRNMAVDAPANQPDPHQPTDYKTFYANDKYNMWLMFTPSGGHVVPLRVVNWGWYGTGILTNSNWVLISNPNPNPNPPDSDALNYPIWTNTLANLGEFKLL